MQTVSAIDIVRIFENMIESTVKNFMKNTENI